MDRGKGLTRSEFEEVIRRATELASEDAFADEGSLPVDEVVRIAGEVGLPEHHVRRALAEMRAPPAPRGLLSRVFGPATVRASREVPADPATLAATLDEFLVAGQLLQPVRRGSDMMAYRPAVDWASQIARAASATSKRYYVASARRVEIRLAPVRGGRTIVTFDVDPGTRNDHLVGAFLGGGVAGVAVGIGSVFLLGMMAPVGPAVAGGLVLGAAVTAAITWATGLAHKRRVREVRQEVDGILDRLEAGASLEPPPPSWRRWVRRHFHGVARDLRAELED